MIALSIAVVITIGLVWLFIKSSRDRCHRCGRVDWLMRMRVYELWVAKEEKPRIVYYHRSDVSCGRDLRRPRLVIEKMQEYNRIKWSDWWG